MFGREILEQAVSHHPESVPARVLLENFHHFEAIHGVLKGQWIEGWGSYMFDGRTYRYQRETLKKQEALFRVGAAATGAAATGSNVRVLEVGVYVGHSLLILLVSNPTLRITCIDCDGRYSPLVVDYLNKHFGNRVDFILGDAVEAMKRLPAGLFDVVHIDADHVIPAVTAQFTEARRLARPGATVVFDDYEALRPAIDGWISAGILQAVETPWCLWTNIVTRLT
jgi:hypothetical protein